ncbi:MAG: hypothetical protein ACUZ8E_05135 [Candidatus Anammoxibacter sp.]
MGCCKDKTGKEKKHPCKDCHCCQFCSDTRCRVCLSGTKRKKQMSVADQIALYEKLNRDIE